MDRLDDSATRQERAEEAEPVGQADQDDVPGSQHVALFLDHDRVDIGRAGDPRHQRGVLDGIPCPVAAPAENLVGPAPTEHHARREEAPRKERPTPRRAKPGGPELAGDERGEGEGEGQGEAGKAGIEHDRMNQHDGMLKQRVQPVAVREALIVGH